MVVSFKFLKRCKWKYEWIMKSIKQKRNILITVMVIPSWSIRGLNPIFELSKNFFYCLKSHKPFLEGIENCGIGHKAICKSLVKSKHGTCFCNMKARVHVCVLSLTRRAPLCLLLEAHSNILFRFHDPFSSSPIYSTCLCPRSETMPALCLPLTQHL